MPKAVIFAVLPGAFGGFFKEGRVLGVRAGPAALDVVDAEVVELFSHADLVERAEGDAGALGAVAQGGVIDGHWGHANEPLSSSPLVRPCRAMMTFLLRHPILRLVLSPQHLWRTLSLGIKTIWLHKLRSFLTALGVVFGVASVVAMLAIGEGASHEAQEQIRKLGSQNIILQSVKPPDGQGSSGESRSMISEYGLTTRVTSQQIRQTVPGISIVVPSRHITENIWNLDRSTDGPSWGALPIYPTDAQSQCCSPEGRFLHRPRNGRTVCPCACSIRRSPRKLFPLNTPTGKSVRVKGYYYRVVGVIQDEGQAVGTDAAPMTQPAQIMIPFSTLMDQYGETFFRYPHRQLRGGEGRVP
jgi:putative ABC transport system permease protein